jgi:TonB family protein
VKTCGQIVGVLFLIAGSCIFTPSQSTGTADQSEEIIYKPSEVSKGVEIVSKPEAEYTSLARENNVTGSVYLWVVFRSNGFVTNIRLKSGLPFGLSERAIAAARKMKFKSAQKDGRPVSVLMTVEYVFTLPKNEASLR